MVNQPLIIRDPKPEIGRRMRKYRVEQGLSLRALGLMIGADFNNLNDIELGRANTTVDMMAKIAAGLGVDFEALFVDESILKGANQAKRS